MNLSTLLFASKMGIAKACEKKKEKKKSNKQNKKEEKKSKQKKKKRVGQKPAKNIGNIIPPYLRRKPRV